MRQRRRIKAIVSTGDADGLDEGEDEEDGGLVFENPNYGSLEHLNQVVLRRRRKNRDLNRSQNYSFSEDIRNSFRFDNNNLQSPSGDDTKKKRRSLILPSPGFAKNSVIIGPLKMSEEKPASSRLYKIIVIGDANAGKSSLIRRYVHDYFSENYRSTVGVDFYLKIININERLDIRVQLWDIAGQDRFSQMTRAYFKGAMGALIVFDRTNPKSFLSAGKWKEEVDAKCNLPDGRRVPCLLVMNKSDLKRDSRIPNDLGVSEFAQENGFVPGWIKTSAKTGEGVEKAVKTIVRYIMAMDTWNSPLTSSEDNDLGLLNSPRSPIDSSILTSADESIRLEAESKAQNESGLCKYC